MVLAGSGNCTGITWRTFEWARDEQPCYCSRWPSLCWKRALAFNCVQAKVSVRCASYALGRAARLVLDSGAGCLIVELHGHGGDLGHAETALPSHMSI